MGRSLWLDVAGGRLQGPDAHGPGLIACKILSLMLLLFQ